MRPQITGITVTKEQVMAILEDWLNTDVFCLCPHSVTDIDLYVDDEPRQLVFIGLQPAPAAVVEDVQILHAPAPDATTISDDLLIASGWNPVDLDQYVHSDDGCDPIPAIFAPRNGNGHHEPIAGGGGHSEAQAGNSDNPAPGKRSRTSDAERVAIFRRYEQGEPVAAIADALGLGRSTVFSIVSRASAPDPSEIAWVTHMLLSDPTLPLLITHAPLRLVVDERWCCNCGYDITGREADIDEDGIGRRGKAAHCPRCHSKRLVPAVQVLHPDEYMLLI